MAEGDKIADGLEKLDLCTKAIEIGENEEEKYNNKGMLSSDTQLLDDSDSESEYDGENSDIDGVILTEGQLKERQALVNDFKEKGNKLFRCENYSDASILYTQALKECPTELTSVRSTLYNNRAAAKVKMARKEGAVRDCTKAISLNPTYSKALFRRAKLYEELDQLDKALSDYQELYKLEPRNPDVNHALQTLPKRIEEQNEKLKQEMLGTVTGEKAVKGEAACHSKLKDLGNLFLRPFGLSTDNFHLKQDPTTGSYSVSMSK